MSLGVLEAAVARLKTLSTVKFLDQDVVGDLPVDARGKPLPYVRAYEMANPSRPFALAYGGTIERDGIVQVSVYAPRTLDRAAAVALAGTVVALFPRGTVLGKAKVVRPSYAASPLQEPPYIHVPVTVPWRAGVREGDQ